jgi:hypothetical protein
MKMNFFIKNSLINQMTSNETCSIALDDDEFTYEFGVKAIYIVELS